MWEDEEVCCVIIEEHFKNCDGRVCECFIYSLDLNHYSARAVLELQSYRRYNQIISTNQAN